MANLTRARMAAVLENELALHNHIANRRFLQRENCLSGERLLVHAQDRQIIQIDGEKISGLTSGQAASGEAQGHVSACAGGAKQQALDRLLSRPALTSRRIQDTALLLLQSQVIFELPRIFENVDLRL